VKLTSGSLVLTCDRMKVWLTKDLRDLEKMEASGSIVIKGRYLTGDQVKTEWDVLGKAQGASYDAKTGQSVLTGSVQFKATNLTTGAVVSAVGDKLVYDTKTRRFRFERGKDGVQVKWQDPQAGEDATSPPLESQSKKGETKE
jgi:lipopolysaccharide export system protein LptA